MHGFEDFQFALVRSAGSHQLRLVNLDRYRTPELLHQAWFDVLGVVKRPEYNVPVLEMLGAGWHAGEPVLLRADATYVADVVEVE